MPDISKVFHLSEFPKSSFLINRHVTQFVQRVIFRTPILSQFDNHKVRCQRVHLDVQHVVTSKTCCLHAILGGPFKV